MGFFDIFSHRNKNDFEPCCETALVPQGHVYESGFHIVDKQTLQEYINGRIASRERAADKVFEKLQTVFLQKVKEVGPEAAMEWANKEVERSKGDSDIKIYSSDMHYFEKRFFRITKSSPEVADASAEGHLFVPSVPCQISSDVSGTYGLCFAFENDIIRYLGYGDELSEINFNEDELKAVGLENEPVVYTPHENSEFHSLNLLVKSKESLMFPSTLKKIIELSDNESLRSVISSQNVLRFEEFFKRIDFKDTAHAWHNVMDCAQRLKSLTDENLNFIRNNIDQIIPEITLDDEIAKLEKIIRSTPVSSNELYMFGDERQNDR